MINLADWVIPLGIGVVVTFFIASLLLKNAYVAVGSVAISLVLGGVTWLSKPRNLDCAGTDARELVSKIAGENRAMVEPVASQFTRQNPPQLPPPPPKSEERIAAERNIAAQKDILSQANMELAQANSWGPGARGFIQQNRAGPKLRADQAKRDLATAEEAYKAYSAADDAEKRAASRAVQANRDAVYADVQKEMKYTLDAIRTTDKNPAGGAVTCAATLKGEAGRFGSWTLPITYKVEETSDRRLYVAVYGLK
jgi:hypothetical protein